MFMNIKALRMPIMTNKKWHTVNSRRIIQPCYIILYFLYLMVCWDYSDCNLHVLVLLQILHNIFKSLMPQNDNNFPFCINMQWQVWLLDSPPV